VARAERRFPGQGAALVDAWRRRQFEYQWLRAVGGRYQDFWRATEDALVFAAKSHNLALGADQRADLMAGFVELPAWPDAIPSLRKLRAAGLRLAFLSNFTERMLRANIAHAGLDGLFEHVLSTDARKTYKPDPRAYELGAKAFGLPASEVLFVAFAGWDAAGAKWYGYPTFWANRAKAPPEELGAVPDAVGAGLADLVNFVLRS
jgi:2-haloacid dehalogenase